MENKIGKGPFPADGTVIGGWNRLLAYLWFAQERCRHHLYQCDGAYHEPGNILFQDKV